MKLAEAERELTTAQLEQRQFQQQLGQCERELSELQARYEGWSSWREGLRGQQPGYSDVLDLPPCWQTRTHAGLLRSRSDGTGKGGGECVVGGVSVAYLAALPTPRRDTILRRVISVLRATAIVTPKQYEKLPIQRPTLK
ncbi:hypothetical protein Pmani_016022 [Petrolisthes manimaculis]|uniref:Uncharacterized protein n=1 Tax=Petrolisthes manimaculis TaxID=1843537 RepID=A0AAE1PPV6_9EUCA|nr:hypothetical protein Pmani_016022 [Petrolisthes manimaculis]